MATIEDRPLPIGTWLIAQKDKGGLIGQLAATAALIYLSLIHI